MGEPAQLPTGSMGRSRWPPSPALTAGRLVLKSADNEHFEQLSRSPLLFDCRTAAFAHLIHALHALCSPCHAIGSRLIHVLGLEVELHFHLMLFISLYNAPLPSHSRFSFNSTVEGWEGRGKRKKNTKATHTEKKREWEREREREREGREQDFDHFHLLHTREEDTVRFGHAIVDRISSARALFNMTIHRSFNHWISRTKHLRLWRRKLSSWKEKLSKIWNQIFNCAATCSMTWYAIESLNATF